MDENQAFYEMVKKWVVSDYRTPTIRSEVIIDMLISEFIEEMIAAKLGIALDDVKLLAKEFPMPVYKEKRQNPKVDYLVLTKSAKEEKNTIYLVELKTTNYSLKPSQENNMNTAISRGADELWKLFIDIVNNKDAKSADRKKYQFMLSQMREKISLGDAKLLDDIDLSLRQAKLKVLYICLHKTTKSENFFSKEIEHFYLDDIYTNKKFIHYLNKRNKKLAWDKLFDILIEIFAMANDFEGTSNEKSRS